MTAPAAPPSTPAPAAAPAPPVSLVEAAVVFGTTVGASVAVDLWMGEAARTGAYTDAHLLGVVGYEVLVAGPLVYWLARRGWSPRDMAGAPEPLDIVRGAVVWLLALGCYAVTWTLFATIEPELARALQAGIEVVTMPASRASIVLVSVVNPVFEEFLWLGYGVARLTPRLGPRGAAALSVALRAAVHLYQGPWAVLGVVPLGLAFTWYYVRAGRLWPVVVAHVLFDAAGLSDRLPAR